jgi:predicted short-subunit dehydrogenase-like oxidoreductase (DUF2520 family)
MKREWVTGLVGAGGVGRSFIARLPTLLASLGPVKATSLRVARRLANSLRAGRAVAHYDEIKESDLIWIAVPEAALAKVVQDLSADVRLESKMVVLCGSNRDSIWPSSLRTCGAYVATLNAITPDERVLAAEGHPVTLRELHRLAAAEKRKLIEMRPAAKPLYFAGIYLASHLVLPSIAASVEALRAAGFSRSDATEVAEILGARSLRAYGKAGFKAWNRAAALDLRNALESDLDTVSTADPRLAAAYAAGIQQALRYFEPRAALAAGSK